MYELALGGDLGASSGLHVAKRGHPWVIYIRIPIKTLISAAVVSFQAQLPLVWFEPHGSRFYRPLAPISAAAGIVICCLADKFEVILAKKQRKKRIWAIDIKRTTR